MSVLERCPSYKESNKRSKERQGPTLGVRFTGVSLIEVSVKRESTVYMKTLISYRIFANFVTVEQRILQVGYAKRKVAPYPSNNLIR